MRCLAERPKPLLQAMQHFILRRCSQQKLAQLTQHGLLQDAARPQSSNHQHDGSQANGFCCALRRQPCCARCGVCRAPFRAALLRWPPACRRAMQGGIEVWPPDLMTKTDEAICAVS